MPEPRPIQIQDRERLHQFALHICACIDQAETERAAYLTDVQAGRALFATEQAPETLPFDGASQSFVPLCLWVHSQLLARFSKSLLTPEPMHRIGPESDADRADAEAVQRFAQTQNRQQVHLEDHYRAAFDACLREKVSFGYYRWSRRSGQRWSWQPAELPVLDEMGIPVMDALGQVMTAPTLEPAAEDYLEYDGPECLLLTPEDCWTWPASNADLQRSVGVYVKYSVTGAQILEGLEAGDYDQAAVDALRAYSGDTEGRKTPEESAEGIESDTLIADSFADKSFDLVECYWQYPEREGAVPRDYLFTIHRGSGAMGFNPTVLRAMPNPWWHRRRPIVRYTAMPWPRGIGGYGVPDLVGQQHSSLSALLRMFIDGTHKRINPTKIGQRGLYTPQEQTDLEKAAPGKFIGVDNPEFFKTLEVGDPVNTGLPLWQEELRLAERASGVSDIKIGSQPTREMTATEAEARNTEGDVLFAYMIDQLGRSMAETQYLLLGMAYQNLLSPEVQKLWESANPPEPMVDPMTGLEVPNAEVPGLQALSKWDRYRIAAYGTSDSSNQAIRSARAKEMFQLLSQDPLVNRDIRFRFALVQKLLVDTDYTDDPEELIGTEEEAVAWQQQQMMAQAAAAQAEAEMQEEEMALQREEGERRDGLEREKMDQQAGQFESGQQMQALQMLMQTMMGQGMTQGAKR